MRRPPGESNRFIVPDWGTQLKMPPLHKNGVKGATGMFTGPVKVELVGVAKSTWNLYRFKEFTSKSIMKLGEFAGGDVCPSTSAGKRLPTVEACWKQTWVAAV